MTSTAPATTTDPVQLLIDAGAIPSAPFDEQSRYRGVPLALWQPRPDMPGVAWVRRRFIAQPNRIAGAAAAAAAVATRHLVHALDRPDTLAAAYLGEPLLYWRIADANAVVDPFELTDTVGRRVDIPPPPGF